MKCLVSSGPWASQITTETTLLLVCMAPLHPEMLCALCMITPNHFFCSYVSWEQRKLFKMLCGLTAWIHQLSQSYPGCCPSWALSNIEINWIPETYFSIFFPLLQAQPLGQDIGTGQCLSCHPYFYFSFLPKCGQLFSGPGVTKSHSDSSSHESLPIPSSAKLSKPKDKRLLFTLLSFMVSLLKDSGQNMPWMAEISKVRKKISLVNIW